ncbi:MAG TPA: hypothetical protein VFQ65_17175 [Kofleriaceae bacterium]|nr:hypothetical protein [Kofleriaceae bacterium]
MKSIAGGVEVSNRYIVHQPAHTPTFASFSPDAALDEFDAAQRRDERFALRVLRLAICEAKGLAALGINRDFHLPGASL